MRSPGRGHAPTSSPVHAARSHLLTCAHHGMPITCLTNQNLCNLQGSAHLQLLPEAFPHHSARINCFLLRAHASHLILLFSTFFFLYCLIQRKIAYVSVSATLLHASESRSWVHGRHHCIFQCFRYKMTPQTITHY